MQARYMHALAQMLPLLTRTLKELVELQHGALSVPCALAFYRKATGQLPVCRCMFPRQGKRLTDAVWREHLQCIHSEDMRILANLIQVGGALDLAS